MPNDCATSLFDFPFSYSNKDLDFVSKLSTWNRLAISKEIDAVLIKLHKMDVHLQSIKTFDRNIRIPKKDSKVLTVCLSSEKFGL